MSELSKKQRSTEGRRKYHSIEQVREELFGRSYNAIVDPIEPSDSHSECSVSSQAIIDALGTGQSGEARDNSGC